MAGMKSWRRWSGTTVAGWRVIEDVDMDKISGERQGAGRTALSQPPRFSPSPAALFPLSSTGAVRSRTESAVGGEEQVEPPAFNDL